MKKSLDYIETKLQLTVKDFRKASQLLDEVLKGIVVLWGGFFINKNISYFVFGFIRGIIITKKSQ